MSYKFLYLFIMLTFLIGFCNVEHTIIRFSTYNNFDGDQVLRSRHDTTLANRRDWKFIVFLLWMTSDKRGLKCGGSLLSKHWVLSAYHCIVDKPEATTLFVKLGCLNYRDDGINVTSSYQVLFPAFRTLNDFLSALGDVALVKLDEDVEYTSTIQPVKLSTEKIFPGCTCQVAGWGVNQIININTPEEIRPDPDFFLREIEVEVADPKACSEVFGEESIDGSVICTKSVYEGEIRMPFSGDSGGPMMCNGKQVGIVSAADYERLNEGKAYAVYMLVEYYLDWIYLIVKEDKSFDKGAWQEKRAKCKKSSGNYVNVFLFGAGLVFYMFRN